MKENLSGIFAVTVTPFKENGDMDIDKAKNHLDWLYEKGIRGVCLLGATGEYQSITDQEHKDYVKSIVPYIKNRFKIIVGASRERPDDVIELIVNAQEYGVDAAMVIPPFYCQPDQNEIIEFYDYIQSNVELPIMAYNNPGSSGVDIERDSLKEILNMENVFLVKESTGDIRRLTELVYDTPENKAPFCGCDNLAFESFATGAKGWISMTANFAPEDCVALYEAVAIDKNYKLGLEIYERLLPSLNTLETFAKPVQAIKHILTEVKDIPAGYVRKPRLELSKEEKEFIVEEIKADKVK